MGNKTSNILSNNNIAIELINVNKTFTIHNRGRSIRENFTSIVRKTKVRKLKALDSISLKVMKGDFFGIVGANGSGKSTLIQIMNRAIFPDKGGEVIVNGTSMRLAMGMGFDRQLTARQNIYINSSVLGLTIAEIDEIFEDIINYAELQKFIDTPIKYYSRGMKSRLEFSIAVYANADIFLLDEFFGGGGDKRFKNKALETFEDRILKGKTVVLVTHSDKLIKDYCNKAILLKEGQIVASGNPEKVLEQY